MFSVANAVFGQTKIGDFKESVNNNLDQSRGARTMQYVPDGRDFLCINGKNRFTRALYGSNTDYRIETSDKPIFALYKPKNYRSLRFVVETGGKELQLDNASYCEARYGDGLRKYIVKDESWGKDAVLMLDVLALPDKEGAMWHFRTDGFAKEVKIKALVCEIANKKLSRNGDMGADKPGCFEPSPTNAGLVTTEKEVGNGEVYAVADLMDVAFKVADKDTEGEFTKAVAYYKELCSRVTFTTPNPYINTLGGALVLAADGVWDGETWLHGAIGWRMPLAGWRAGYLGDVLGWNDRAISHFDAYAASQVTDKPVVYHGARQDAKMNMARAEKTWGTEMYSNGYICRNPNRNNQMHHYDMNLNYMDELLWHFQYDADTAYMRKMWPVITSHLAWEKMNFDSDNDHLYDAYCCIWASDALYYSDGAVTHSSAYNYRGNLLAAKIARLIGEDPAPYQEEADAIKAAMDKRLWVEGDAAYVPTVHDLMHDVKTQTPGHWAEYQDKMGLQRVHPDAALWSVYTPIDCGVGSEKQMAQAAEYVDKIIPHIAIMEAGKGGEKVQGKTISTSDWMPYSWSINNVASAEVMHTALALYKATNDQKGYSLMMANIMDQMYLGQSPGNFGQVNYYDAARGECYRDFGDNVGISARTLIQGLFGIEPNALDGVCTIRPGFPLSWDSCEVKTPYLTYKYKKVDDGSNKAVLTVEQSFSASQKLEVRIKGAKGDKVYVGNMDKKQAFLVDIDDYAMGNAVMAKKELGYSAIEKLGLTYPDKAKNSKQLKPQNIAKAFNAKVTDIFNNEYISPRPTSTSLEIPTQGVGEWCHPAFKPEINDSVFRAMANGGVFVVDGIPFNTPQKGENIVFTSLWDNYPAEVSVTLKAQKAEAAYLLMAGSTNHMQTHLDNALVVAQYSDNTTDTLHLLPPFNWCPIEQDYYVDGMAFQMQDLRPVRVCLGTGTVSDDLGKALNISKTEVYGREIKGGGAQMLRMPLNKDKKVVAIKVKTLANDVVVGLMGVTLCGAVK